MEFSFATTRLPMYSPCVVKDTRILVQKTFAPKALHQRQKFQALSFTSKRNTAGHDSKHV